MPRSSAHRGVLLQAVFKSCHLWLNIVCVHVTYDSCINALQVVFAQLIIIVTYLLTQLYTVSLCSYVQYNSYTHVVTRTSILTTGYNLVMEVHGSLHHIV